MADFIQQSSTCGTKGRGCPHFLVVLIIFDSGNDADDSRGPEDCELHLAYVYWVRSHLDSPSPVVVEI